MKPNIDPKVDCVFKAVLGKEENVGLLIHFLNAVLQPPSGARIQQVQILNPYNEKEFESDKLSVVDIKARDEQQRNYQIEIQLIAHEALLPRMLYTWSAIYHSLLRIGEEYTLLRPVIAIWLINDAVFPAVQAYNLPFLLYNAEHRIVMTDHLRIHILQLPQWHPHEGSYDELDRWMYFFNEGQDIDIDYPPAILQSKEMQRAMNVLHQFSEREKDYLMYEKRLDTLRMEAQRQREQEITRKQMEEVRQIREEARQIREEYEQLRQEAERAQQEKERAQQEKERAQQEKERAQQEAERAQQEAERAQQEAERLLVLLKQAGITPT